MSSLIEQVLQLPYDEKVALMHALEADLARDEEELKEDDLSKEQWGEIFMREKMLEYGEMKWISADEFDEALNAHKQGMQARKSN